MHDRILSKRRPRAVLGECSVEASAPAVEVHTQREVRQRHVEAELTAEYMTLDERQSSKVVCVGRGGNCLHDVSSAEHTSWHTLLYTSSGKLPLQPQKWYEHMASCSAVEHDCVKGFWVKAEIFAWAFLMSRAAAVQAELRPHACIVLYLTTRRQTQSVAPAQPPSSSPSDWQQLILVYKSEKDPELPGFCADQ